MNSEVRVILDPRWTCKVASPLIAWPNLHTFLCAFVENIRTDSPRRRKVQSAKKSLSKPY